MSSLLSVNPMIVYTLDDAISSFFADNTSVTRQQCDDFARSRVGGPVDPVEIQGMCSYTVIAGADGSKLFQFRAHHSEVDMAMLNLAETVHPQFVASCKYYGTIGQSQPLYVYEMDKLPGTTYVMARECSAVQSPDAKFRQLNTAKDFAKFFAQSWNNGQRLCPDETAALLAEFRLNFDLLSRSLPSRFASNLDKVRKELPLLFSGALPFVLSHGDLCEMNMLINPETGGITGIIDWAEARILPFGFSLLGFENVLGFMDSEGWHYYDNRYELEDIFWQTFLVEAGSAPECDLQLIRVARMAGLFYCYGFIRDDNGIAGVVKESESSLAYLDAFCGADDWAPAI